MKSKRMDIFLVCFLVCVVGIFYRQTIFDHKVPVPTDTLVGLYYPWRDLYGKDFPRGVPFKNFLITDPVRQQIPWRKIVIDQLKEGKIPAWSPFNLSGSPILANIQAAPLYPLNILFLFLPFVDAWMILIVSQSLLAGIFMYWYLRSLGLRPVAGLIGGLAWSYSGFNVAWLTWGTIGHVALWLPLSLLAVDKLFSGNRKKTKYALWSVVFILSVVFQFFAGHIQISLYFIFLVLAYGVMRIHQAKDQKISTLFFILLVIIAALCMVFQAVPFLEWIKESGRFIDSPDWNKEEWFIPWNQLVQFVSPDFFGNPATLNYWGKWNYGEFIGYIGILPLAFAFVTFISRWSKKYIFWIGACMIALLFALPSPVASLPFILRVPLIRSLQPTRLLFVVDFSLAVLASFGLHEFLENPKKSRIFFGMTFIGVILSILWSVIGVFHFGLFGSYHREFLEVSSRNLVLPSVFFFIGFCIIYLYQRANHIPLFRYVMTCFIIGLVVIDLLRFGWKFTPFTPREYFFPDTKIITFLKSQEKPFRVMSIDKRILPPNTASFFGIESIEGYDPIIPSRYEELVAAIARQKPDVSPPFGFNRIVTLENYGSAIEPLLNARYILSSKELTDPYLKKVFVDGETIVYEDARALPRIYLVDRLIRSSGKAETIEKLYGIPNLRLEAVVEGMPEVDNEPIRSGEFVTIIRYESSTIEMNVHVVVPRLLVISNMYNRGWRATVDGNDTYIFRTNYAFQGIVVPEGNHRIVLSYTNVY